MPMVGTLMETQIKSILVPIHATLFPEVAGDPTQTMNVDRLLTLISKIGTPVVTHIQSSALVIVNPGIAVQVAFPAGTGSTISPGTGTIT